MYIWKNNNWPNFTWDDSALGSILEEVSQEQGRLQGRMESLGFNLRSEANLKVLTESIVKSSEIEGEVLPSEQVRSSVARRLGLKIAGLVPTDRNIDGIVEMMIDATSNYNSALSEKRLCSWHASLFPVGYSGMSEILVAQWRDDNNGPMQVVSGAIGHEKVHYQAPPATRVSGEMGLFLNWFSTQNNMAPLLRAGLAHLWIVTIHPFDDGNGRIARAVGDMALARAEKQQQRFYSMSSQIRRERNTYYDQLERAQKGTMDITPWQEWFLKCLLRAIRGAQTTLSAILEKDDFWKRFTDDVLNDRQIKMLNKLLSDFDGKLTTSKWAKICKCSQDSAYRDILNLIACGALQKNADGGRSTNYELLR